MAVGRLPEKTEEVPGEGENGGQDTVTPPSGEVDPTKDPEAYNNSVGR